MLGKELALQVRKVIAMKRILVLGIAMLLLLNGYPQRIVSPQNYWSDRIQSLQKQVALEQEELDRLNRELTFVKKEGIPPTKRAVGVKFSPTEVQEFVAQNYEEQKRLLKQLKSRTEALKNAQGHYVNSLQG